MSRIVTSERYLPPTQKLADRIVGYWDRGTRSYEFFLGDHIHFGYVEEGATPSHDEATDRLIERLVEFGGLERGARVLDVGCGLGGTAFLLAQRYDARVTGANLSTRQVARAREKAEELGVTAVDFQIADAHALEPFEDGSFDTVWCVESAEQYHDKQRFLAQAHRVLRPGGKLVMTTWCSSQEVFTGEDARAYEKFCRTFDCPYMPTVDTYARWLGEIGFEEVHGEDWSEQINRTWTLPPRRPSTREFLGGILRANRRFLRYVFIDARRLRAGFSSGRVRYGVLRATKPANPPGEPARTP